jgi:hypothetical protein
MASWKMQTGKPQSAWHKFCGLTWGERWLLLQAAVFLLAIAAALHIMNFQQMRSLLARFSPDPHEASGDAAMQKASVTSRLVQAAAGRMPFPITCLVRSTALWFMLRRQGIDSEIRIGVNQEDGAFHAHAWVEIENTVLNDRADIHSRFIPFDKITPPVNTERV